MPDRNNRDQFPDQDWPHRYVSRKWHLVPVRGRYPLIEDWPNKASCDHGQVDAWLERFGPKVQWALAPGRKSGVIVLDVDFRPEGNGRDTLEYVLEVYFQPTTPVAHSPRGGYHVFFASPDHEVPTSIGKLGRFLDVKGERSLVTLPPVGSSRFWDPHLPYDLKLAPMPDWMNLPADKPDIRNADGTSIAVGELSAYCEAALRGARREILNAPPGARHDTLLRVVFSIAGLIDGHRMPAALALDEMERAAIEQPRNKPRPSNREILRTVRDSFAAGLRHPREKRL